MLYKKLKEVIISVELMRQLVKNHADLETKLYLEGVMTTLIYNPIYEFHPASLRLTGKNLIRQFYRDHFETFFPLIKSHTLSTLINECLDAHSAC